jgi:hypothetical protein
VFRSTGTPCPVQGRANSPYQRLAPYSAAAVAALLVPSVTAQSAEGTVEELDVVVVGEKDILAAVAQLVVAEPSRLVAPVRIASRSSPAAPAALTVPFLVVAGVVVVLRFPLCLLYAVLCVYIQNLSDFFCCFPIGLI